MKTKVKKTIKIRTKIFAYKGIIGIESDYKAEGLINDPASVGQLGFLVNPKFIDISKEAFALLKKVKKGTDSLGDIDIFKSGKDINFGWLGGSLNIIDKNSIGSRDYDVNLLNKIINIVPNEPPKQFKVYIDEALKVKEVSPFAT